LRRIPDIPNPIVIPEEISCSGAGLAAQEPRFTTGTQLIERRINCAAHPGLTAAGSTL
jgi:hypothetical protein